jgi:hypothetical protein
MAQDGGKVVSLTHRLFLPPGYTPGTHFGAVVILRGKCGRGVNLITYFHPEPSLSSSGATTFLIVCLEGENSDNFCGLSI